MYEQKYKHYSERNLNDRQLEEMLERRRKMKLNFTKPNPHRFDEK